MIKVASHGGVSFDVIFAPVNKNTSTDGGIIIKTAV